MQVASYYRMTEGEKVECLLCPHQCLVGPGRAGICRVRRNEGGKLVSAVYGKSCALRFDPIEKKPLYHYYPGSIILSIGTVGCNLHCKFCQNWEISQTCAEDYPYQKAVSPEEVVEMAAGRTDNIGIAYTYNEPTVFFEYMLDMARLAKEKGLKNVAVTNGFINSEPLAEMLEFLDAFNVDLKAFDDDFYRKMASARLEPVKETIRTIRKHNKHLEITNLVIAGVNDREDTFTEMVRWIAGEAGKETPLHLSRYFPNYKLDLPSTPEQVLMRLFETARKHLTNVYLGNMYSSQGSQTYCPGCHTKVIDRSGYSIYKTGLDDRGRCRHCGLQVISHI